MLDKKYNHDEVEKDKYKKWLKKDYFKCDENSDKKPFCIVLPPPNVTGVLHLGHAWDVTLQDIIIRYKKMEGFDVLWLPGMICSQEERDRNYERCNHAFRNTLCLCFRLR